MAAEPLKVTSSSGPPLTDSTSRSPSASAKGAAAALIATGGVGVPGVVRKPKARMAVAVAGSDTSV